MHDDKPDQFLDESLGWRRGGSRTAPTNDRRDQFVDELLKAALKHYRGEEPRAGLEMRILAGIQARERAARRRWLGWAAAACAGVLAAVVLTLHLARAPLGQPASRASLPPREASAQRAPLQAATQAARAIVSQQRPPSLGAHRAPVQQPQQRARRAATRPSRPEQFPTPLPLTEQEKLLLTYLDKATKPDLLAGTNVRDEAPVSDLQIPRIRIAALEIKPLDDSQSEQEK